MKIHEIKTSVLKLVYEESGPKNGKPVFLVHGWPDSPRTWDKVLPSLHDAGYRTIAPYLRGYGPSEFRSPLFGRKPRRTGQPVAFAQDMVDLADALKLQTFDFVGHDWGARTGLALAALFPQRLERLVTISVPFEPGPSQPPKMPQAQAYWYQWYLCSIPGEKAFRADPVAYGKRQWDTWSPEGWYSAADLAEAAKSWTGKDFTDVVLHGYRSRWGHAEKDPAYAILQARFESTLTLGVPTVLLHGIEDHCTLAETTDGAGRYFTNGYRRILLDGVGHFPQRENPKPVAEEILRHLQGRAS
jgi:pimeloyl-ACP methyl ester carboxylesterase